MASETRTATCRSSEGFLNASFHQASLYAQPTNCQSLRNLMCCEFMICPVVIVPRRGCEMSRTKRLQAIRKMRGAGLRGGLRPGPFEEAYEGWNTARLTQTEAARVRGRCARRFRRYLSKYEAHG